MPDGISVRTLEDLREHFDLERVVGYYLDGKLLTWLQDRYYSDETKKVEELIADDINLGKKLCEIVGVSSDLYQKDINVENIDINNQRLAELKQYTVDSNILNKLTSVAFCQTELDELLRNGKHEIYLCENTYAIPLNQNNIQYIGLGNVRVHISSKRKVDFLSKKIYFKDILFDNTYLEIIEKNIAPISKTHTKDIDIKKYINNIFDDIGKIKLKKEIVNAPYIDSNYDWDYRFSSYDKASERANNRRERYCEDCTFYLSGFRSPNIAGELAAAYILQIQGYINKLKNSLRKTLEEYCHLNANESSFYVKIEDDIYYKSYEQNDCSFCLELNNDIELDISTGSFDECFSKLLGGFSGKIYKTDIKKTITHMDTYETNWLGNEKKVRKYGYELDFDQCTQSFESKVLECCDYIYQQKYTQSIMSKITNSAKASFWEEIEI